MPSNFDVIIPWILRHEGGYSCDPADPGGATNFGISLRYLRVRGLDVNHDGTIDENDIKALTLEFAENDIYRTNFWLPAYDCIRSIPVAAKVMDMSVNMGSHQSHLILQRAAADSSGKALATDGTIGGATLGTVNSVAQDKLLKAIEGRQCDFYIDLAIHNVNRLPDLKGWVRRAIDEFVVLPAATAG